MLKRGYQSRAWNSSQNWRVPLLVVSLVLMLVVVLLFFQNDVQKPSLAYGLPKQKWKSFDSLVQLHPTVEFLNGTEVIWQIPESPKAVLFLAHGCNGRAINFWDRSHECPNCIGLPEERLLVLHGLAQGFAVISISSAGRCWTLGQEASVVKNIIQWWTIKRKLEKLPLVALGASSGGYFVSVLATIVKFSSIVIMIAEGKFEQIDVKKDYPPTLFVHMPKDVYRLPKIDEYMEVLKEKGIDVAAIECLEFPLSPNTLSDRIPGLDQALSARLFEVFQEKGFIDRKGYMKKDGRAIKWKKALEEKKTIVLDKHLVPHIQEELNLAFAYHEMTSVHSDQIFKWFESHMS
ncbi:Alpha/Beta hydrolase fold [Senna tora]|uniref:Alpha/Beta hydrolase fold n=1 Tax=Senna tora TaxID=362788 RepID=A0A834WB10_9FABA|nr:Alpha/Beta hydrolase fold [Senna tora]